MSVRLTSQETRVALFDSASGIAFGPTFESDEDAEAFLRYVADEDGRDVRDIPPNALRVLGDRFSLTSDGATT